MIENIRKYQFVVIFSIILVFIALVIGLQSDVARSMRGGHPYIKVSGRTYSDIEYRKLGIDSLEIIMGIARNGEFGLYEFVYSLSPEAIMPTKSVDANEVFFINRMLVKQAKEEFGIWPSDEEISEYTRKMRSFCDAETNFDPEAYKRFVENGLGQYGMTEKDFRDIISDVIATDKISQIIGAGLAYDKDTTTVLHELNSQKIAGSIARLNVDSYRESIKPTDEELKTYWELIQDNFKTEPQRRFTYILVGPEPTPADESAAQDTKPSIADAAMTDEAKAKAEKEKAEAKAKKDAELAEARRLKQQQIDAKVDDFTFKLVENQGKNFEESATENQWEIKTTALFTPSNPPADLNLSLRSSSRGGTAAQELFNILPTADPVSRLSEAIGVGENQWLVARLDEEIPSRTKTFEEALEQVRSQYISEKANEALHQAAKELHEKIKTAIAEGKSFSDAISANGLKESKTFQDVNRSYRANPVEEPGNLFYACSTVDPGSLAEPILEPGRAFIVFVSTREVVRTPEFTKDLEQQQDVSISQNSNAVLRDWLASRTDGAKVERYYRQ